MRWAWLLLWSGCLFPSLDDLGGGGADGAVSDVASNDVSTSDAADVMVEAAVEASGPFCPQSNAVLCSDFDETGDAGFASAWDFVFEPGATSVVETSAFFTSPPRSLLIATTNADLTALARKDIGYTNGITLEFDLRMVAHGSNPSVASFSANAGSLTLQPRATQTNISEATSLADGGTSYMGTSGPAVIASDTWVHVIYDFDRVAKKLTVTADGNVIISYTPANPAWASLTSVTVHIGVGNSASETAYYDDVTIRVR